MSHYNRVLVGVEVLEGASHDAFEEACDVAKDHDAMLVIAFVLDKKGYASLASMDPYGFERLKEQAGTRLKAYQAAAQQRGVTGVQTALKIGVPRKEMVEDLCKEYSIDVVVIGQSGGSKIDRLLLGNTAKAIQKKAICDVKVVGGQSPASEKEYAGSDYTQEKR
ncbi:universal stress protein [Marinococcus luteus]|uniref:universal stress protein n=1 Tax=Marinococcus luteus TaxID=1122204 RepID=UPI002ACC661A|nr:universal stress protein [Marinococcus luteus]MDZ5781912.1 universal stress protein [Marinococcus luteus]